MFAICGGTFQFTWAKIPLVYIWRSVKVRGIAHQSFFISTMAEMYLVIVILFNFVSCCQENADLNGSRENRLNEYSRNLSTKRRRRKTLG